MKTTTKAINTMAGAKHHYTWKNGVYSFSLYLKDNRYIHVITPEKSESTKHSLSSDKVTDKNKISSTTKSKTSSSQNNKETKKPLKSKKSFSSFERIFWITILIFALITATVFFMAFLNTKEISTVSSSHKSRTVLDQYIDKYFPTDQLKENLVAKQKEIQEHLQKEIDLLNSTIEREVNNLFSVMEYRVDTYLNYHYSVAGEYSEIYAMASNKINALIREKLIGNDFDYKLKIASDNIYAQYKERIEEHLSLLNTLAFEGVDISLDINQQSIQQLEGEIIKNQMLQEGKFSLLITGLLAKKISAAIATKIATKASGKLVAKGAVKVGTKLASATGVGAVGLLCGPGAIVCAPVLAIIAWFATDAIIVTADEHLNRDAFKSQINSMISSQKYNIKRTLQGQYAQTFEAMSESSQAQIAMTTVHEKRRVKVSDKEF